MKVRPLGDRVVVKRVKEEETTRGGIIIPDSAKEKPIEAEILALGQGRLLKDGKRRPMDLKVGDHVLLAKWSGNEVKIEGEEVVILREEDILGVVER